ncbi:cytochrome p450, partial [Trifolium pratense]
MRLQERHVPCHLSCPLCNHDIEDDWHVLVDREVSIQARQTAGLEAILRPMLQRASQVREVIHAICSNLTEIRLAFLLCIKARHLWHEWAAIQQVQQGIQADGQQQQQQICWQKPSFGWYKCNIDAAFHKKLNKTSMGWCARDYMGRFVLEETTWMNGNCSIVEGESLALLAALKTLRQHA